MNVTKPYLIKLGSFAKKILFFLAIYFRRMLLLILMGSSEFKTVFGGITSILIKLAVISISIMLAITAFQRGNTSSGVSMIIKDITNDPTKHYFTRNSDVYFAVKLLGPSPEKLFDTSYIKFEIVQNSYIRDNSPQGFSITSTPIEYEF